MSCPRACTWTVSWRWRGWNSRGSAITCERPNTSVVSGALHNFSRIKKKFEKKSGIFFSSISFQSSSRNIFPFLDFLLDLKNFEIPKHSYVIFHSIFQQNIFHFLHFSQKIKKNKKFGRNFQFFFQKMARKISKFQFFFQKMAKNSKTFQFFSFFSKNGKKFLNFFTIFKFFFWGFFEERIFWMFFQSFFEHFFNSKKFFFVEKFWRMIRFLSCLTWFRSCRRIGSSRRSTFTESRWIRR